jgi:hypothetical protein
MRCLRSRRFQATVVHSFVDIVEAFIDTQKLAAQIVNALVVGDDAD